MFSLRRHALLIAILCVHGCTPDSCPTDDAGAAPAPPPPAQRLYRLPFEVGSTIIIGQGSFGVFGLGSHACQYAVDFVMPVGTKILAARGGRVVGVGEDCANVNCPFAPETCCGNYVQIEHDDGTMAQYYHLVQFGACVEIDAIIQQGDVIGRSGNTGYSIAPHLHFNVYASSVADATGARGRSTDGSLEVQFTEVPRDGIPRTLQYVTSENVIARDWCSE